MKHLEFLGRRTADQIARPAAQQVRQRIDKFLFPAKPNCRILVQGGATPAMVAEINFDNRIPAGHAAFFDSGPYARSGYGSDRHFSPANVEGATMSHYPARMSRRVCLRSLMIVAVAASGAALAQEPFPSKPIRLVVPTAGGTVDLIARYVAPKLSEAWGQPVVVDTKAGASGNIAAAMVAKAPADGYTILTGYNPLTISAALRQDLKYNLAELAPITLAVSAPQILVVHSEVPAANVREFIALAKARNGALSYASISPGSASHLTMELFNTRAGIRLIHVPYKGAAPAINDLLGMHVQAGFFVAANVIAHVKSGQLRALAVTGGKRLTSLPNLPTVAESAFPFFDAMTWIGFLAPAGTPVPIIEKYHREIVRILRLPDVRARVDALDFNVIGSTPEAYGELIRSEITTWSDVAKNAGVRLD